MAVIKAICPKCGQKVSGDDSFFGRKVTCPICTWSIAFPENPQPASPPPHPSPNAAAAASPSAATAHTTPSGGYPGAALPSANAPAAPDFYSSPQPVAYSPGSAGPVAPEASKGVYPSPAYPSPAPTPGSFPSYPSVPAREGYPQGPSVAPSNPQHPMAPASGPFSGLAASPEGDGHPSPLPSILALVFAGTVVFSWLAVLFGHIALAKAPKPSPYRAHALTGLILGYAGLILSILILSAMILLKAMAGGDA